MQNGDRYAGHILSMTSNSVVLESDVLGKVTLPREKISSVTFGNATAAVAATPTPKSSTTHTNIAVALRGMTGSTNTIEQVRQQMLTGADPAATQKYNELVSGLMTGKLNVNDIRSQARTSIEQINQLKRELGPEAGDALDSYLAILQNFVNETESTPAPVPVTPIASPSPAKPASPYAPAASFGTNSAPASRSK